MRDDQTCRPTRSVFKRPAWFRVAGVVIAVEVAALLVLVVAPKPTDNARPSTARLAAAAGGGAAAGPSNIGRHPVSPTTVPPAPTTTVPAPTTTSPPAPTPPPAPRIATPPPAPRPTPPRPTPPPPPAPGGAILPPRNPSANIAAQPNFLATCSASADDNSSGCINSSVAAIDN